MISTIMDDYIRLHFILSDIIFLILINRPAVDPRIYFRFRLPSEGPHSPPSFPLSASFSSSRRREPRRFESCFCTFLYPLTGTEFHHLLLELFGIFVQTRQLPDILENLFIQLESIHPNHV